MGNDGIIISDSEPTTDLFKKTWLKIYPDGKREWYEYTNDWGLVKTEPAPTTIGVTVEPMTDEIKITHIKIANGLITEFEWEDMGD